MHQVSPLSFFSRRFDLSQKVGFVEVSSKKLPHIEHPALFETAKSLLLDFGDMPARKTCACIFWVTCWKTNPISLHKVNVETLCATPVSITMHLWRQHQDHAHNCRYESLAGQSTWTFLLSAPHKLFISLLDMVVALWHTSSMLLLYVRQRLE